MADYPWFPAFVDLSNKRVLVVGAGAVAARRVEALMEFCPCIDVIGPRVHAGVESAVLTGKITLFRRPFVETDLDGADIVLAATDDEALNARIAGICRERGVPVNVSSDRTLCDFYFPGVAVDGDLVVGITASGRNHKRAKDLTRRVRSMLKWEGE